MPTYEYTCAACGNEFERFESITAAPNKTCPKCHKKKAERRISGGGGFIFKGSGFYLTDYKKTSAPGTDTGEKKSEPAKTGEAAKSDTAAPAASCATGCGCHPAPAASSKTKSKKSA